MFYDFEYDNKRLSDFGFILCRININSDSVETDIGCDITFTTVKNNHSFKHSKTSSVYENVYTTTFEIMKNPCLLIDDNVNMDDRDIRSIVKWLNRRNYNKFKPYRNDNNACNVHYFGSFNIKKISLGDNTIGLSLTFTSNSPYAYEEEICMSFSTTKSNELISIWGDSDELDLIYPNVKITCLSDGDLKITNITTNKCTYIKKCSYGETIYMDGEHKIIISDNEEHSKTLPNDFVGYDYLEIDLFDYNGNENIYEISFPCNIDISYSPIRKIGVI